MENVFGYGVGEVVNGCKGFWFMGNIVFCEMERRGFNFNIEDVRYVVVVNGNIL